MLRLNRLTDYAIVTLVRLVEHSAGSDAPLSARKIAEIEDLPEPMVKNALKALHQAQFVTSVRGAGGGYRLAEDPKRITLTQIIESIEGPVAITPCCDDSEEDSCMACRLAPGDRSGPSIQFVNDRIRSVLNDISLHQMVESTNSHEVAGVELTIDLQLLDKASL